jgi:hypothetical protein
MDLGSLSERLTRVGRGLILVLRGLITYL